MMPVVGEEERGTKKTGGSISGLRPERGGPELTLP